MQLLLFCQFYKISVDTFTALLLKFSLSPCLSPKVEIKIFPTLSSIPQKPWHKEEKKLEEILNYARPFLLLSQVFCNYSEVFVFMRSIP